MNPTHVHPSAPLVSVCMPAYNVEKTLALALQSVFAQTYAKIEIVLVDDGSTDGTAEVARSFTDKRLRYVRNARNLGGFQTMNRAMSLAQGDLVAVYHTDDFYEPAIIEKEVAFLGAHPDVGAVFCLDDYMDDTGKFTGRTTLPRQFQGREVLAYEEVFRFLLRHKNVLLRCPTFMARRPVLEAVGPFDAERFDVAADLDMWIRIVRRFPIAILNERLMRYRRSAKQWSYRYKHLRTEEDLFFAIMDHYVEADAWRSKLTASDQIEYSFHRCDDETFRAANKVILGDPDGARELLRGAFPWRTLLTKGERWRRKVRVMLLRTIIKAGLALGATGKLARLLQWTEYGGPS